MSHLGSFIVCVCDEVSERTETKVTENTFLGESGFRQTGEKKIGVFFKGGNFNILILFLKILLKEESVKSKIYFRRGVKKTP